MTVDVLDAGLVVREVRCYLRRRVTGSDWRAQVHRAAQYRDIALALGVRRLRRRLGPTAAAARSLGRSTGVRCRSGGTWCQLICRLMVAPTGCRVAQAHARAARRCQ